MQKSKLTLLIYMAADNSLKNAALQDLESIRSSTISGEIEIVVQLEKEMDSFAVHPLLGSFESFRYHFKEGKESLVKELGPVNSGDPEILKAFIEESAQAYPSEKLMLIIGSHGTGIDDQDVYDSMEKDTFLGLERSNFFIDIPKIDELNIIGIAYDESAKDFIDNVELKKALDVSVHIDVLGFDACQMGMFEVAYQIRNQADVLVFSEYVEPAHGWDYAQIVEHLTIGAEAEKMAEELVGFYANSTEHHKEDLTLSAVKQNQVEQVAQDLDAFAEALLKNVKDKKELKYKFLSSQLFGRSDYVDLIDFLKNIEHSLKIYALEPYIKKLLNSLDNLILANYTKGHIMRGANGVAIYFPSEKSPNKETFEMYEKLDFSKDYPNWIALIKWYYS